MSYLNNDSLTSSFTSCRLHDQAPTYASRAHSYTPTSISPLQSPYTRHFSSLPNPYSPEEGPDILPRFSPTQSRPRSYFNSEPYPASYQPPSTAAYSTSPDTTQFTNSKSSTALQSLRELATALPKTSSRKGSGSEADNSPPKSSAAAISRTGSGVWDYMPFTGAKTAMPTPSTTPGNSYTTPQGYTVSTSYGAYGTGAGSTYGARKDDYTVSAKSYGLGITTTGTGGYGNTGGMGMDRPLPPRSGPGGYGHRPRSIDLVTPYSHGH
jgi:hypothetical protein